MSINLIGYKKAVFSGNSLKIQDDITVDEWKELGQGLKQVEGCVQFWIGDWARFGDKKGFTRKYTDSKVYDELEDITEINRRTIQDYKTVSENTSTGRHADLGFSHHREVAKLEPEKQQLFLAKANNEGLSVRALRDEVQDRTKKNHVINNSGNNEWYTPTNFIESARYVMGTIDLDPASNEFANKTVKATNYFSKENDGLKQDWYGNVWLNPPYSQPEIGDFILKITEGNFNNLILITNNATETKWGNIALSNSNAVCFVNKRISFLDYECNASKTPLQGQMINYYGSSVLDFINEFKQYGVCLKGVK